MVEDQTASTRAGRLGELFAGSEEAYGLSPTCTRGGCTGTGAHALQGRWAAAQYEDGMDAEALVATADAGLIDKRGSIHPA